MLLNGRPSRTIWPAASADAVTVIDQRALPHRVETVVLRHVDDAVYAIAEMVVRGAPLIGVTAAYGLALQARADAGDVALQRAANQLKASRPTAVNLAWAVDRMLARLLQHRTSDRVAIAWTFAAQLADDDAAVNERLGSHGFEVLRPLAQRKSGPPLNVLTHCNAGWLATVDWGTALAPIYRAQAQGVAVHVWVDETRPRNQGASLTAFELREQGVPHTVVADNAGGHLMQRRQVDAVIVGCDRVTASGDVANKIGTYLKALAAHDCGVPFWVAMPLSTLDRSLRDGVAEIPIEERRAREVTHLSGRASDGTTVEVQLVPDGTPALNPAFDVTPARLVTGLITERGVVPATRDGIASLFEEQPVGATDDR
ncbi:MAG TPA: S-methyl-5-thioribose-1-phosphate isomerase [Burkholderiaceae bacterium]|nr:S-methyl-5-thioribose-1-phosphate isomerase [Burkholderiaceae bacterium]